MCSVWTCSRVKRTGHQRWIGHRADVLCKCHSGCTVAGWGWGATLTESASASLSRNRRTRGLLTVIPSVLLLFLLEQRKNGRLLAPMAASATGRSPDNFSGLYRQPSCGLKCGSEPPHSLFSRCRLSDLHNSRKNPWIMVTQLVRLTRLMRDWLAATQGWFRFPFTDSAGVYWLHGIVRSQLLEREREREINWSDIHHVLSNPSAIKPECLKCILKILEILSMQTNICIQHMRLWCQKKESKSYIKGFWKITHSGL